MKAVAVVTGAAGQLGSALLEGLAGDYDVVGLSRQDLDVTDHEAVMRRIVGASPAVILNATAYNNVDGAEDDAITAFNVNAMAVRSLARAAEASGAVLVHYSTDFVFDGETDRPYTEEDLPSPRSVYGQSKLVGEWMAASIQSHYVLRVESLFGGQQARSSIDKFIAALRDDREVRAFVDREVSPSYVLDVVTATLTLLARRPSYGVYHCVNSGHAAWLALARRVADRVAADPALVKGTSVHDVQLRASRPRYAALDNSKLAAAGVLLPSWEDALDRYLGAKAQERGRPVR